MSNLLKSKFFLGALVVAVMFVGVVAVSNTASAQQAVVTVSDIQYAATVKMGSSGQASIIWQRFLNGYSSANLVNDGAFGPLSSAAAKTWQASRGLTADGILGALSRASAVTQIGGAMTGNFPAGCTSASGYSTTTGVACNTGTSAGLPAGCSTTAGYSPLTGTKCDSTTPSTPTGPLTGGAGSLDDVQELSSLSSEEVSEGQNDVKVAGWTLTADNGSDLGVTAFKLTFEQTDTTSSDNMDDYIDGVTVWQGSTKVGSANASEFSENNGVYSKTINLTGAVVKADKDSDFFVSVDAVNSIDSADLGDNTFALVLESVRVEDATGVVLTDTTTGDLPSTVNFSFETIATTTGLELKVSNTTGSAGDAVNDAHVVDIDDTSDTNDISILAFDLKATGAIQNVQNIPVQLTSVGTGTVTTIANGYSLWKDGTEIDSVSNGDLTTTLTGSTACTTQDTCYINFNDVDFDMADGATAKFVVKADINDTAGNLVDGDTLQATMTGTDVDAIEAEDANGDNVGTGDLTGTATADAIAFYDNGMNAKFISATAVATPSGVATVDDTGTFVITFDVTAFGSDVYVDGTAIADESGGATYQDIDASTTSVAAGVIDCTGCDDGANTTFKVADGTTERFTVTIAGSGADVFASASLTSILYALTAIDGDVLYTFNMGDYTTSSVWLDSN